jgi:biotin carboxyl carrier protein
MAYIATVNEHSYHIDVSGNGMPSSITLEGQAHAIDWRQIAQLATNDRKNASAGGHYSLIIAGASYDVFARCITRPDQKDSETFEIHIAGQRFEIKVEDERTRLLTGLARGAAGTGVAEVQAPMPGLVVGVPVEQGTKVEQGQTVVVLEAMKMENDLSSPISGTVKEVRVSKGQTVDQNETLIVIAARE